ncbi:MAG: PAS domain-containing protein [Desulfobulbaceae bacterium]|nr:PAS domain-containing protein [Desulfobulbaceae bacterium]
MSTKPSYNELTQEVESLREQLAAAQDTIISLKSAHSRRDFEQERFVSVMQAIPEGAYVVNQGYGIEYVNPVLLREFGPVNGRKCFQYLHNRTEPCLDCKNKEVFAGKSIRKKWYSRKNNKYYVIFDSPLKNAEGVLNKLAFFHDATAVQQATEMLVKNQLLLDGIVNNSTAVICIKDTQGKYLMANTRFNDLFNESGLDIIGKTDFDFFPEYQARLFRASDRKVLMGRQVQQFEENLRHKDRDLVYISIKFPLVNADDSVYAVAKISTDITDRKKLEVDLQASNERLTALINASPDIICLKDGEGRWLQANEANLRLFQISGDDYKGRTDVELAQYNTLYGNVLLASMKSDEDVWHKGQPYEYEEKIPNPNGEDKIFWIIKVPLFYPDGRRKGLVILGHDTTVRRKREQRLRREIVARKQAFEVIRVKSKETEEVNIALRVLLNQQKKAGEEVQQRILIQFEKTVLPYIELLRRCLLDEHGEEYLDILTGHLQAVGAPFIKKLSNPDLGLTKREILVADLVRQGKSTKEIAKLLGLQPRSVEAYRNQIRKKLHLNKKNITLKQYLTSTFISET